MLTAALGYGVTVLGVSAPCDALSLAAVATDSSTEPTRRQGDGTFWIPRARSLLIQAGPGRGARVTVRAQTPVLLSMVRLRRRGPYARVHWSTHDGSSLTGWVRQDALRPMPQGCLAGSTGGIGTPGCVPLGHATAPDLYRGVAQLREGAPVYAEPGVGRWAHYAATGPVLVEHWRGSPWVRLVRIPGVSDPRSCGSELSHAWLAASDVHLPEP